MQGRRALARLANTGLILSGLALVIVLGTGGTRLDLQVVSVGLREAAGPLSFFCFFAALRLLVGARHSGLEAALVTVLARQGLPPRDAPASAASSARAGALLGMGLGLVAAVADLARLIAATPRPLPPLEALLLLALAVFALGLLLGAAAGVVVGLTVALAAAALGRSLGRYDAGRISVAILVLLASGLLWLAPSVSRLDHTPRVLLVVAASVPLSLALVFVLLPAAVQRARRGRWGVAVGGSLALAVAVVCAAVVVLGPLGLNGPARDAAYPNVLLVSISGLRWDYAAGAQGEGRFTPALRALAARGAAFRNPVSPSTALAPAAASLLTGLYPASHGLRSPGGRLKPGVEGLPVALLAHGFRTAAFVSSGELNGRETGLADLFERYDDPTSLREWLARTALGRLASTRQGPSERARVRSANETVEAFREWSLAMPRGPWFAWVELGDPLWPRPQAAPVGSEFPRNAGLDLRRPPPLPPSWASPEDRERTLGEWLYGYARAVQEADAAVDKLEQIIATRGELQHTVTVVTAEQGAAMGEGGVWFERGREPADDIVLAPWIVAGPAIRSGARIAGPCSLVDVAPTLLGLIGLGGGRSTEGEDLSRHLVAGGPTARDPWSGPVFSETAPAGIDEGRVRAVWFGRWKLVRLPSGRERLCVCEDGEERELLAPRGPGERQWAELSDMLTRRQAQEADIAGSAKP